MEKWKTITGFEDYLISNYGNVKSLRNNKLLSTEGLSAGYPTINLRKDNLTHNIRVHRLVAREFVDNPNKYELVNHKDHDRTNNHYTNLEWTNQAGNMLAAAKLGIGNSTFNEEQIIDIKIRLANGERGCDIADHYGVSRTTISEIKSGKNKVAASIDIDTSVKTLPKIEFTKDQILEVKSLIKTNSIRKVSEITGIKTGTVNKMSKGIYDKYL